MGWFGKKFKCEACGAKFKTEGELADHAKTHAGGQGGKGGQGQGQAGAFECDICMEFFDTAGELKAHKKEFH
jgi:hypothetical protein